MVSTVVDEIVIIVLFQIDAQKDVLCAQVGGSGADVELFAFSIRVVDCYVIPNMIATTLGGAGYSLNF